MRIFPILLVGCTLTTLLSTAAYADPDMNCEQKIRRVSLSTAHAIAAMTCSLLANNLTEKQSRTLENSANFVHKWSVKRTDDSFVIEGTCATRLMYYDGTQELPKIAHPGYHLQLTIPRQDDRCSPIYEGKLSPVPRHETDSTSSLLARAEEAGQNAVLSHLSRSVLVRFHDSGYRDTETNEYKGVRSLAGISLGLSTIGGLSQASISEGGQAQDNKMGIGMGAVMTQWEFGHHDATSDASALLTPDFSDFKADFQMNKSSDPSLANRDMLHISGFDKDIYVRQSLATEDFGDDRKMDKDFRGGSNAFFVHHYDQAAQMATMGGCTDYSYDGTINDAEGMNSDQCRARISAIPRYIQQ